MQKTNVWFGRNEVFLISRSLNPATGTFCYQTGQSPCLRSFASLPTNRHIMLRREYKFHFSSVSTAAAVPRTSLSELSESSSSTESSVSSSPSSSSSSSRRSSFEPISNNAIQRIKELLDKPTRSFEIADWDRATQLLITWPKERYSPHEAASVLEKSWILVKRMAQEHSLAGHCGRWWVPRGFILSSLVKCWYDLNKRDHPKKRRRQRLFSPIELFYFLDETTRMDPEFRFSPPMVAMILERVSSDDEAEKIITMLESRMKQEEEDVAREYTFHIENEILDESCYNLWLTSLTRSGNTPKKSLVQILEQMRQVVQRMWSHVDKGYYAVRPTLSTYHILFQHWATCQNQLEAKEAEMNSSSPDEMRVELELLQEMIRKEIVPDPVIYELLLRAWCSYAMAETGNNKGPPTQIVRELWEQMIQIGAQPTMEEPYLLYLDMLFNRLPPPTNTTDLVDVVKSTFHAMKAAHVPMTQATVATCMSRLAFASILAKRRSINTNAGDTLVLQLDRIKKEMENLILEQIQAGFRITPKIWNHYLLETFFFSAGLRNRSYEPHFLRSLAEKNAKNMPSSNDFLFLLRCWEESDSRLDLELEVVRVVVILRTLLDCQIQPTHWCYESGIRLLLARGEQVLGNPKRYRPGDEIRMRNGILHILSLMEHNFLANPTVHPLNLLSSFCNKYYPLDARMREQLERTRAKILAKADPAQKKMG